MSGKVDTKTSANGHGPTPADLFDFDEAGLSSRLDLHICRVIPVAPVRPEDVLTLVGRVRWPGDLPIARAIAAALTERGLSSTDLTDGHSQDADRWHPIARQGIDGKVGEFDLLVGTADFIEDAGILIPDAIRTLLADHESQGWQSILVGACRGRQGSQGLRRSLIGVISLEPRSSPAGMDRFQGDVSPRPAALLDPTRRGGIKAALRRIAGRVPRMFTLHRVCIAGLVMLSALAGLWSSSLTIRADEVAVVQRFGVAIVMLGPGLHIRPFWPFEKVTRLQPSVPRTATVGLVAVPAGSDVKPVAAELMLTGDVWPGESATSQSTSPAGDVGGSRSVPQLLRVRARVQYGIAVPTSFLFVARDPDALVTLTTDSILRALVAARSASVCLGSGRPIIAERATKLLQTKLDALNCGITVDAVFLDDIQPCEGAADAESQVTVLDRIEAGVFSQIDSDRIIAEAQRKSLDLVAAAEKDRDLRIRKAREVLEQVQADAAAYARDPEGTRRRLLIELANEMPGGLAQLRRILADTMSPGRRPAATQEGGTR